MLCIHCRKHAERHTNCHRYRCCVDTEKDQCTWQPKGSVPGPVSVVELDPVELEGARISLEVTSKIHNATLSTTDDDGSSGPTNTSYYVKYKKVAHSRGRGKASTWLDLELPVGAKCSWWRLDGYDTCSEGSGANAEEPTVGGMMELSLSNSDESSDESESG